MNLANPSLSGKNLFLYNRYIYLKLIRFALPLALLAFIGLAALAAGTGSEDDNLYTFDADGTLQWSFLGTPGVNPTDGAEMVWVPGGTFTMGTSYGRWWDPATQEVTLSGYWIYKYEVTVAQYLAFCWATSHQLPPFPSDYSWSGKSGWWDETLQQHPIVNVTWNDAFAYADWAGVSLPTEAQWEFAARGPAGNTYPWGGTATDSDYYNGWDKTKCANYYNSDSVGTSTWPVGSFPSGVSWCGAQDMAGNVWQWCSDWYGNYSASPVNNPTGPAAGDFRVLRGGSWNSDEYLCRGAFRFDGGYQDGWDYVVGFRCVSSAPGPAPLSAVSLAGDPVSPVQTDTELTLTATPTGGRNPQYQFWVRIPGSAAKSLLRDYDTLNTCQWTPTITGNYTLLVYARESGSGAPYQVYQTLVYQVKAPPLSALSLTGNPVSPVAVNTHVTLTVIPTGGLIPEYQFWVREPGSAAKSMLRDYSEINTFTWTPTIAGSTTLLVYARESGSGAPYQVYQTMVYNVISPLTSLSLEGNPASPVSTGANVTLTATPTGGVTPQYQFWIRVPGSSAKSLLRDYSTTRTCVWTPTVLGTYTLLVYARESGSGAPYQVYQTLVYSVTGPEITAVALAGNPVSPTTTGSLVTLTATPTDGVMPEFQFWVRVPGSASKTLLMDYSITNSCSWTPAISGTYTLLVYAREKGSAIPYRVYKTLVYTVN